MTRRARATTAEALSTLAARLTRTNREDLHLTASTLTAVGDLRPAGELVRIPPAIWDFCPEPRENRLHPTLAQHRAVAGLCRGFHEQTWMLEAANRAFVGTIDEPEREAPTHGCSIKRRRGDAVC